MRMNILLAAMASAASMNLASAAVASAYTGSELAGEAKVGIDQARAIALKAAPGTITSEELEREDGGSGLRYTFDIKAAEGLVEIGVDAASGAILENGPQ